MPEIIPNLHPLAVHFPVAFITVAAIFHVAAAIAHNKTYAAVAHTTLWLGALGTVVAVFFGWQAFNSVNHDEVGHAAMLVHRTWALGTLIVLAVLAGWDAWRNKADTIPSGWFVTAVLAAWVLVGVTAWHGGELVYRHGLGVMALPTEESGHHHDHGDAAPHPHADEAASQTEDYDHGDEHHHDHQ